ncbi:MAG TPA: ATP-binding protein [Spirochaetia bacterium]|nr:ATP-binding protein [Spirochaetia bacterium]
MIAIQELMRGDIPPRVRRFVKTVGRGINEFRMINEGDSVLLGVSGGKDSLSMALALSLRRRWLPIKYELHAVQIEWAEFPLSRASKDQLSNYFEALEIPFQFLQAHMFPESFRGKFNCYLCSRNRKRILFDHINRVGINKIALGHHLDDIIETTLMNLFYHGSFGTMMPVQNFFDGETQIIRPMCRVTEAGVRNISAFLGLPVVSINCPHKDTNLRSDMKMIIQSLTHKNKQVRENIYRAPWNIITDYLPEPQNSRTKLDVTAVPEPISACNSSRS